jgi:hypothetical protein
VSALAGGEKMHSEPAHQRSGHSRAKLGAASVDRALEALTLASRAECQFRPGTVYKRASLLFRSRRCHRPNWEWQGCSDATSSAGGKRFARPTRKHCIANARVLMASSPRSRVSCPSSPTMMFPTSLDRRFIPAVWWTFGAWAGTEGVDDMVAVILHRGCHAVAPLLHLAVRSEAASLPLSPAA